MARQFQMPESLDIGYRFFNGKFTIKDMIMRSLGIIPGSLIFFGLDALMGNKVIAAIPALIVVAFGYWVGAKKVFNGTVPLLTAIKWQKEMQNKSTVLINYRREPKAEVNKGGAAHG